jgi:hypothetical protein
MAPISGLFDLSYGFFLSRYFLLSEKQANGIFLHVKVKKRK